MKAKSVQGAPFSSSVRDVETFNRAIGGRLKHIRTDVMGLSVADMAAAFELGTSTIQRYESGERTPDTLFLVRVAERAEVPLAHLLHGEPGQAQLDERQPSASDDHEDANSPPNIATSRPARKEKLLGRATAMVQEGRGTGRLDDADLVKEVVLGVEKWEVRRNARLAPEKRATLIALLFRYFQQLGEMSSAKLEELLKDAV